MGITLGVESEKENDFLKALAKEIVAVMRDDLKQELKQEIVEELSHERDGLMSPAAVAKELFGGGDYQYIKENYLDQPDFPHFPYGKRKMYLRSDVLKYLRENSIAN